jgi:phosphate-selective porin OprO/OprP
MSNTQPFKYNAGFMYDNQKILDGKIGFQMSYTFNGDKAKAFQDKAISKGGNFVARLTTNVLNNKEKHQTVHLGVNYENRQNDSDEYHYAFRTENHMSKAKISAGTKYLKDDDIKTPTAYTEGNFIHTSDIGFELATTYGSFSIQTEYEMSSIITDVDVYKAAGYYAFASFFLTGEHRPYKKSSFGRVKPKKEFCLKDQSFGAVELVTRYSVMDFSSYPGVNTTDKVANITAGFNWYLNNHVRIMYNYTLGDYNDFKTYGDFNLTGHLIRFQVDF